MQFIDSARFMASSLPNLANTFLKEFIELNVNADTMINNMKHVELNISIATVFLNTQFGIQMEYKCLYCNKSYQRKFERTIKRAIKS